MTKPRLTADEYALIEAVRVLREAQRAWNRDRAKCRHGVYDDELVLEVNADQSGRVVCDPSGPRARFTVAIFTSFTEAATVADTIRLTPEKWRVDGDSEDNAPVRSGGCAEATEEGG